MTNNGRHLYIFGQFQLSATEGTLSRDGHAVPLTPKAFDLLLALVKGGGHVLTKEELLKTVWADVAVDENNLPTQIATLRKVIGDGYVETVPRRGYRFTAEVTQRWEEQDSPAMQAPVEPAGLNGSLAAPDSINATAPSVRSRLRGRGRALLAVATLLGLIALGLALRNRTDTTKPAPLTLNAGRLFAQATSESGRVLSVKLDNRTTELLIAPDGTKLYALEYPYKALTVFDGSSLIVKGTIALLTAAGSAVMSRDGKRIYLGSQVDGVMVVDTEHDRLLERVLATGGPVYSLAVSPDEEQLFVAGIQEL